MKKTQNLKKSPIFRYIESNPLYNVYCYQKY